MLRGRSLLTGYAFLPGREQLAVPWGHYSWNYLLRTVLAPQAGPYDRRSKTGGLDEPDWAPTATL